MASVLTELVIDCENPQRVGQFWSDVLGWPLKPEKEFWWASSTGSWDSLMLVFAPVPEKKTSKNRVHIDVSPSGADQAEELERLLALGARRIDVGQGDVPWIVLEDPEGNEFCLLGRRVDAAPT
jgi:predicted enzyme related to lactoylglutathione lyase